MGGTGVESRQESLHLCLGHGYVTSAGSSPFCI